MPEMDYCGCCGNYTFVHGNPGHGEPGGFGRRLMLCDDCCVCYNHCPGGKYYEKPMKERL